MADSPLTFQNGLKVSFGQGTDPTGTVWIGLRPWASSVSGRPDSNPCLNPHCQDPEPFELQALCP